MQLLNAYYVFHRILFILVFKQEYLSHETRAELHQSSWKIFEKFLWSMVKSQWYS